METPGCETNEAMWQQFLKFKEFKEHQKKQAEKQPTHSHSHSHSHSRSHKHKGQKTYSFAELPMDKSARKLDNKTLSMSEQMVKKIIETQDAKEEMLDSCSDNESLDMANTKMNRNDNPTQQIFLSDIEKSTKNVSKSIFSHAPKKEVKEMEEHEKALQKPLEFAHPEKLRNLEEKEMVEQIRVAFESADKKKRGKITGEELVHALARLGVPFGEAALLCQFTGKELVSLVQFKNIVHEMFIKKKRNHIHKQLMGDNVSAVQAMQLEQKVDRKGDAEIGRMHGIEMMKGEESSLMNRIKRCVFWREWQKSDRFDLNCEYRIRLLRDGGYINVEQVTPCELYFGVSAYDHFYGCVESGNPNKWHYRMKGNCQKRANKDEFSVYRIETRGDGRMGF